MTSGFWHLPFAPCPLPLAHLTPLDRLQIELGQPLGRAHDIRGIDSLVGRDEDEAFDAKSHGKFGEILGPDGIVPERLKRLVLHHGHVFVGGGMKYQLRAEALEDARHVFPVENVGDERHD
jgi:hypothetical protein